MGSWNTLAMEIILSSLFSSIKLFDRKMYFLFPKHGFGIKEFFEVPVTVYTQCNVEYTLSAVV